MSELEYKLSLLYEDYLEKLKKVISRRWDLLDMMVYEGYKVDWEKILYL